MTAYHDLVTTLSPVAQFKMNETSGTICTDSASGSNDGAYEAAPDFGHNSNLFGDFENTATDFEASSSQYVSFTGNELTDLINGAGVVAIEMWGTVEAFAASLYVLNTVIDATTDGLNLLFDASGVQVGARSVVGDSLQTLHHNWTTINTKVHIVVIADFNNDALYIFKDGEQVEHAVATFANAAYTKGTPSANDTLARGQTAANYYDGKLSNINLYTALLTPLQIRSLYRAGIAQGFDAQVMALAGIQGYWLLNEDAGAAKDWVAGNNGTVNGGVTRETDGGLVSSLNASDKAYLLDGVDGHVDVGSGLDSSFVQNTGIFSIACWVKMTDHTEDDIQTFISSEASPSVKGFLFGFENRTSQTPVKALRLFLFNGTGTAIIDSASTNNIITDNNWHFVAAKGDATNIKFFVDDAVETGSGTMGTLSTGASLRDVNFGRYNNAAPAGYLAGPIQKMVLSSSTFSDASMRSLYQSGLIDLIDRGFAKVLNNLSPDGYWRIGEGADRGIVFDESGNDNDGVPTSVTFAAAGGIHQDLATAITLDGAAGEVSITDETNLQNIFDGAGGSVLAIVKVTSDGEGNAGRIVDKRGAGGSGWAFYVSGESGSAVKISFHQDFDTTDGIWDTTATDLPTGAYALVILTYDSDAVGNDPIIYVGATASALTESSTPVGTRVSDIGSDWLIGNDDAGGSTFDGSIMQVSHLKGTILTAQQVKQINEAFVSRFAAEMISKQPAGYWRQNEPSGTTAIDYGADGNDGTYTNGPSLAQSDSPITNEDGHTTTDYDGADDHCLVTHAAETSIDATLLCFMKAAAAPSLDEIVFSLRDSSNDLVQLQFENTGEATSRYRDSGASIVDTSTPSDIPVSSWVLIAGTLDNTNDLYRININGFLEAESTTVLSGTFSSTKTIIGAVEPGTGVANHFDGGLSEAARFTTPLTTEDILDILEMASYTATVATGPTFPPPWQLPVKPHIHHQQALIHNSGI